MLFWERLMENKKVTVMISRYNDVDFNEVAKFFNKHDGSEIVNVMQKPKYRIYFRYSYGYLFCHFFYTNKKYPEGFIEVFDDFIGKMSTRIIMVSAKQFLKKRYGY